MKVLLKNKNKRKGQPKYDPTPYTITALHGRQATLQQGERKIRRETQKFKRFFETPRPTKGTRTSMAADDWEESRIDSNLTEQPLGASKSMKAAPSATGPALLNSQTDGEPESDNNPH